MTYWLIKKLRQSEIGWFKACRRAGRETGRQRGLNLPSDLVEELFEPGGDTEVDVRVAWHDGARLHVDVRPLRRQGKNWRLVGPAVEGERFAFAAGGDLIVMSVDSEPTSADNGAATRSASVVWDLLSKDNLGPLDDDLPEGLLTGGFRAGIRRLTSAEAAELLDAATSQDLLASFRGLPVRPTSRTPPGSSASPKAGPTTAPPPAHHVSDPEDHTPTTELPPNSARLIEALRAIGYTFPQAIADLVDNSVNAHARTVLVRLFRSDDTISRVMIADDGDGMSSARLLEAMRFGSELGPDPTSLGKYGLGMKLASLSRCRSLTVASRQAGVVDARRWNVDRIQDKWLVEGVAKQKATSILAAVTDRLNVEEHGTVVLWENLDRVRTSGRRVKRVVKSLIDEVELHLGMCFHRFLEQGKLRLLIDAIEEGAQAHGVARDVKPRNPFGYERSGLAGFPVTFWLSIPEHGALPAEAHVWPAHQGGRNYKLDGKVNERQGFYFYRNDRLIQAGGWNGYRKAPEPHLSLARISIDLPAEMDSLFALDVKKSGVREPPWFATVVREAQGKNGETFPRYLQRAQVLYRRRNPTREPVVPLPGPGIPSAVRKRIAAAVLPEENGEAGAEVDFMWMSLPEGTVVDLDVAAPSIVLNQRYRSVLLEGRSSHPNDAPLLKLALLGLVCDAIEKGAVSGAVRQRLARANAMLFAWIQEANGG